MDEIPDTPIYCTANAVKSIEGQYGKRGWDFRVVKTRDTIDIGNGKQLIFVEMRMLHWPDSMANPNHGTNRKNGTCLGRYRFLLTYNALSDGKKHVVS